MLRVVAAFVVVSYFDKCSMSLSWARGDESKGEKPLIKVPDMPASTCHLDRVERLRQRFGSLVGFFRVRQVVTWLLSRIPFRVGTGDSRIRIRCWADILAYQEIFRVGIYDPVFDGQHVRTYCDLGCQSGMALLRLVERVGPPQHAVLVDGNPYAIERARENVRSFGLEHVQVVHGAVGCDVREAGSVRTFVVKPNELECCLAGQGDAGGVARAVAVPVIDLETLWLDSVGDVSCDLLKIDVEGAELGVLRHDRAFLTRVRRCVLEWHDPPITDGHVRALLREAGFGEPEVLYRGENSGVLVCEKHSRTA